YVDRTYLAAIHAALGDKHRAMTELEQAYADRSAHMTSLWLNPWYRSLHRDPRFDALVSRIAKGGHGTVSASVAGGSSVTTASSPRAASSGPARAADNLHRK
ncbi:MAG: hypothetical protein ACREP2_02210, partial [Rhodanobacteraceae bacterium]